MAHETALAVHYSRTGIWLFFDRDHRYEEVLHLVQGAEYDAKRHLSSSNWTLPRTPEIAA
jgi:hypothetical protein